MLLLSAKFFPGLTIEEFLKTEADLDKIQRRAIAHQLLSNPTSKEDFMTFVKSMTPMDTLYTGMIDEVEKATKLTFVDWSGISAPTLAVHSTIDIDVPLTHAERLENMIPHIQMEYVKAGGHFVWWGDEGETVKKQTLQFLNQQ